MINDSINHAIVLVYLQKLFKIVLIVCCVAVYFNFVFFIID